MCILPAFGAAFWWQRHFLQQQFLKNKRVMIRIWEWEWINVLCYTFSDRIILDFFFVWLLYWKLLRTLKTWDHFLRWQQCNVHNKTSNHVFNVYNERAISFYLPFLLVSRLHNPLRHASVISPMLLAQRPIAWMVAAAKSWSELVTYVWNSRNMVEMFASVARLVRISSCGVKSTEFNHPYMPKYWVNLISKQFNE